MLLPGLEILAIMKQFSVTWDEAVEIYKENLKKVKTCDTR